MVCKKTCTLLYLVYLVYKQNMYFNQNIEHGLALKASFCNPLPFPQNKTGILKSFWLKKPKLWRNSPYAHKGLNIFCSHG